MALAFGPCRNRQRAIFRFDPHSPSWNGRNDGREGN
ncbi:hypothetical protein COLO4_32703 [Corchorus olitorius]|uniref:Uncharacterized protein n=1 Tax=Corchorus olitorius TaxID=93759 RepID=A0A1R3GYH7_9ROSI|nr:hypothetical protein COLO4_32703 [Corchorus olitorius]